MEYIEEVRTIMAGVMKIPVAKLNPDAEMTDIDEWDSLRNIMIISRLEDYYGIMFPEDDIFNLTSVRNIAEEVEKLKAE